MKHTYVLLTNRGACTNAKAWFTVKWDWTAALQLGLKSLQSMLLTTLTSGLLSWFSRCMKAEQQEHQRVAVAHHLFKLLASGRRHRFCPQANKPTGTSRWPSRIITHQPPSLRDVYAYMCPCWYSCCYVTFFFWQWHFMTRRCKAWGTSVKCKFWVATTPSVRCCSRKGAKIQIKLKVTV